MFSVVQGLGLQSDVTAQLIVHSSQSSQLTPCCVLHESKTSVSFKMPRLRVIYQQWLSPLRRLFY
ncbi:hypothetical protein E2C01_021785 [Portunus trituberculatus]|uniref:Uncharacterized protein n=1 Tax=Portunus trituberculatus TaxID=210409 RepID=A0A5B7E5H4_PORTR|nr:hypothetical protein [Portunus trituberculatus]